MRGEAAAGALALRGRGPTLVEPPPVLNIIGAYGEKLKSSLARRRPRPLENRRFDVDARDEGLELAPLESCEGSTWGCRRVL